MGWRTSLGPSGVPREDGMKGARRGRAPRAFAAALAAAAAVGLLAGCATRFALPEQSPTQVIPGEDTYVLKYAWEGFAGAKDVFLTRGSLVYVAEAVPGSPDAGRVRAYFRSGRTPSWTGIELPGLLQPTRIAEATDGTIFVLDEGAPAAVKRFDRGNQALVGSFTDPGWREAQGDTSRPNSRTLRVTTSYVSMRGLAVDEARDVYVAWTDTADIFERDLIDTSVTRRFFVVGDTIRKYSEDGIPLLDVARPGTGEGFVNGPGGLHISPNGLLVADVNKNWVQLLDPEAASSPLLRLDGLSLPDSADPGFMLPEDVSSDAAGNIYVADTVRGRVLKYTADGTFDQRVDYALPEPIPGFPTETEAPIALATSNSLVYALDRTLGIILVYELRSVLVDDQ